MPTTDLSLSVLRCDSASEIMLNLVNSLLTQVADFINVTYFGGNLAAFGIVLGYDYTETDFISGPVGRKESFVSDVVFVNAACHFIQSKQLNKLEREQILERDEIFRTQFLDPVSFRVVSDEYNIDDAKSFIQFVLSRYSPIMDFMYMYYNTGTNTNGEWIRVVGNKYSNTEEKMSIRAVEFYEKEKEEFEEQQVFFPDDSSDEEKHPEDRYIFPETDIDEEESAWDVVKAALVDLRKK